MEAHQRLPGRVHFRTMQRMARYDLYIRWQVFIERLQLRGLAGSLPADNSANLGCFLGIHKLDQSQRIDIAAGNVHTRPILCDYPVDGPGLYTV